MNAWQRFMGILNVLILLLIVGAVLNVGTVIAIVGSPLFLFVIMLLCALVIIIGGVAALRHIKAKSLASFNRLDNILSIIGIVNNVILLMILM